MPRGVAELWLILTFADRNYVWEGLVRIVVPSDKASTIKEVNWRLVAEVKVQVRRAMNTNSLSTAFLLQF